MLFFSVSVSARVISFNVYEYEPIEIKQNSIFEIKSNGTFSKILKNELTRLIIESNYRVRETSDFYREPFKKGPPERSSFYVEISHRPIVTYNDFSGMSFEFTIKTLDTNGIILQEKRKILALENIDIKNGGTNIQMKHRSLAEEIVYDWEHGMRADSKFIRINMSALAGRCDSLDSIINRLSMGLDINLKTKLKELGEKCKLDESDSMFLQAIDRYTKTPPRALSSLVGKLDESKPYIVQFKQQFIEAYKK